MAVANVPDIVIGRLPLYLRALNLLDKAGYELTSSQELGGKLGISSAQIRKDLSHFGEFGKQGTGYEIKYLRDQISRILHVDINWPVVLVGFGDLGQAIAHYRGFASKGFYIKAIFDNDPSKIGQKVGETVIQNIKNLDKEIPKQGIVIAIVSVPAEVAQTVVDILVKAGIKSILNYAPITLKIPNTIKIQHIDPVIHLQRMSYYLTS